MTLKSDKRSEVWRFGLTRGTGICDLQGSLAMATAESGVEECKMVICAWRSKESITNQRSGAHQCPTHVRIRKPKGLCRKPRDKFPKATARTWRTPEKAEVRLPSSFPFSSVQETSLGVVPPTSRMGLLLNQVHHPDPVGTWYAHRLGVSWSDQLHS